MRRLGELPFVVAVRDALPWSFIGLAAAFRRCARAATARRIGARTTPWIAARFGAAPGLRRHGDRVGRHAVRYDWLERPRYAVAPLLIASRRRLRACAPAPVRRSDPITYLRTLGASGLFIAILACGGRGRRGSRCCAGECAAPVADYAGAALAIATFALACRAPLSISGAIAAAMQPISQLGDTYFALIAIVAIETMLWTAGVHGPAMLAAIVTPVYLTMQMQNTHAFALHAPLPYIVVVSLFLFVFPGGAGATLPLAVLFAISHVPRLRRVGRATLLPALFNLNEPLLFAAPVVFNPHLALPFVGAPLVLATVTYVAVATGLVSRAAFYVPSSVPTLVSTYLATQDLRAIALVLLNIAIATVIYYPFFRAYERHLSQDSKA